MCSGLRDVANLCWKLDRVLRGESDFALLDTYTSERSVHLQHAIAMSVELGRVICVLDEQQAADRDARMIAGGADPASVLPVSALPVLGEGVLADSPATSTLRGTLAPQFPVERDGHRALLDDVTGDGPVLLTLDEVSEDFGGRAFTLGPGLRDPDGDWTRWFEAHHIRAVLIRPDHYVFGAVTDPADTQELVARYGELARARTSGERISCA
jgi:hypothetical protein